MIDTQDNRAKGYEAYWAADYETALRLFMPFARQGDAEVQCAVGSMYQLGLGVEVDCQAAMEWYLKSGRQGYGLAYNNLASMYVTGCANLEPDAEQAGTYYRKAAENGFRVVTSCG